MKVLITGSSGFIGSRLVDWFRAHGVSVMGVDVKPGAFTDAVSDIRDYSLVKGLVRGADAIVHCAAQTSVPRSVEDPVYDAENNVAGTLNLLEAAKRAEGLRRFIYLSSAAVYGRPSYIPLDEEHPCRPISPYGVSKLAGELYARVYFEVYGVPTVCIRPFNVYGRNASGSEGSGVIAAFAERIAKGLPPIIYGSGMQTRDFVHVDDVAEMVALALRLEGAVGEVFNCGTGRETRIRDLAEKMIALSGLDLKPEYAGARAGDIERSCADVRKAEKILGFKPKISLEEGLKELVSRIQTA